MIHEAPPLLKTRYLLSVHRSPCSCPDHRPIPVPVLTIPTLHTNAPGKKYVRCCCHQRTYARRHPEHILSTSTLDGSNQLSTRKSRRCCCGRRTAQASDSGRAVSKMGGDGGVIAAKREYMQSCGDVFGMKGGMVKTALNRAETAELRTKVRLLLFASSGGCFPRHQRNFLNQHQP